MKFFTLQLWRETQEPENNPVHLKYDQAHKDYMAQLEPLRGRLSEEAFYFFADADVHDGELMEMRVVDASRPAPLSEPGRPWNWSTVQFPVAVHLEVLDGCDRFLWNLVYRGVRRVLVDFPSDDIFRHTEGHGFGDWGYHELTAADDLFLRHEVLFASGSILLFEFQKVEVTVREARGNHGYSPFFRPLTDWEKGLLRRMLQPDFPGRDALLQQVDTTHGSSDMVNAEEGSLRLRCRTSEKASIPKGIRGTLGQGLDADGGTIHYSVSFNQGTLTTLCVIKDGSSKILQHPDFGNIQVSVHS